MIKRRELLQTGSQVLLRLHFAGEGAGGGGLICKVAHDRPRFSLRACQDHVPVLGTVEFQLSHHVVCVQ